MQLSRFHYTLPPDRIAQHPAERRDGARLLRLDRATGAIATGETVADLVSHVREGDCWVINDTRVRPARLLTRKPSGARVELLVIELRGAQAVAMYGASKPLKPGQELICDAHGETVRVIENLGGGRVLVDLWSEDVLEAAGQIPLPPYISRAPDARDRERYQTVYADEAGAVAAPTAGLHFTPELMAAMEARGATFARVTLHVGPGTFRPIREEDVTNHVLDAEPFVVTEDAADAVNRAKRVVAVGTTAVRTLEAAADGPRRIRSQRGRTGLYITPGYAFQVVEAMLTNFHLPGSSLLVLVAAFAGLDPALAAYARALDEGMRFYSYGDAMLIS